MKEVVLCWLRRDLRLHDNHALFRAHQSRVPVIPVFIFDTNILGMLDDKADPRVHFIRQKLTEIQHELRRKGADILIFHGKPADAFLHWTEKFDVQSVHTNEDYEPYARKRDEEIRKLLESRGILFEQYKDQVIFHKDEIRTTQNEPYKVFTPYSRKWKEALNGETERPFHVPDSRSNWFRLNADDVPSLEAFGFRECKIKVRDFDISAELLRKYTEQRDIPHLDATSHIGPHLRFGTVSIREVVKQALKYSEVFLNELIWREFFMQLLWHFPQVTDRSFHEKYDSIEWNNDEGDFEKWMKGMTGIPMVDAGMRQLNETGYMHNRVRMITANFLTRHLLTDWRWGESYFASKLLDYELSSNNGNWQWAAGTGADAAPYFRIFNPETQQKRFDPDEIYIRRWIPEYGTKDYPPPVVDLKKARDRALEAYKRAAKREM